MHTQKNISNFKAYNGEKQQSLQVMVSNVDGDITLITRNLNREALTKLRESGNKIWWCINGTLIDPLVL